MLSAVMGQNSNTAAVSKRKARGFQTTIGVDYFSLSLPSKKRNTLQTICISKKIFILQRGLYIVDTEPFMM